MSPEIMGKCKDCKWGELIPPKAITRSGSKDDVGTFTTPQIKRICLTPQDSGIRQVVELKAICEKPESYIPR